MFNQKKRKANRTIKVLNGVDRVIDGDGVIIDESPRYKDVNVKQKTRYATMYLDDENMYEALKGLGNSGAVWGFVLVKYDKENNIFHFSGSVKEQCRALTGLSDGTVRSSIAGFCDSGLLLKIRNAEYMVNPRYFYKGHWDNREEVINEYEAIKEAKEMIKTKSRIEAKTIKLKED